MADLFQSLKPHATPSKNGFDLSRKHVFSSQAGMALPCLSVETVPGDHFEIDLASLTRTQTFNTAAFLRGKMRFDFFFVPYSQLWHPFNQFISQRTDKHSTRQLNHLYCPVVSIADLLHQIGDWFAEDTDDMMEYNQGDNAVRLLNLLGYGDFSIYKSALTNDPSADWIDDNFGDLYVNPFRLAAYQHIWYDYYRNKYFDVDSRIGSDTQSDFSTYIRAFNFDDVDCGSFANSIFNINERFGLLMLRYIPWKKDIFTSALPSQQFGVVSSVDIGNVLIKTTVPSLSSGVELSDTDSIANLTYQDNYGVLQENGTWNIPSAFDVLSLRKAEALQAWKQNTLRAGNMTDSSFEAHYGVKPYYEGDENVHYLGSFSSALQVNAVEATATTNESVNGVVGDLAATGTCVVNGNKIQFDCKDFGVIMCINSFLPEAEYTANSLDKANRLYEQFDFFTPEFQNIGLEAVSNIDTHLSGSKSYLNNVIGYAPRYWMYKSAVDKVFGEFDNVNPITETGVSSRTGSLNHWVAPRQYDVAIAPSSRPLNSFYVDPYVYHSVFGVIPDSAQNTDYFLNNVFFDIKAIRPMSVLGLPQF